MSWRECDRAGADLRVLFPARDVALPAIPVVFAAIAVVFPAGDGADA